MRKPLPLLLLSLLLAACGGPVTTDSGGSPPATPGGGVPGSMPCSVHHASATPEALAAEFAGKAHVSGPDGAPVTLIAFSDYQCTSCAVQAVILRELRRRHPDDLRFVYFHAPHADQDKDVLAIRAAEAADLQAGFWEMHDLLFERLPEWSGLEPEAFPAWAADRAAGLGLDRGRFLADFDGEEVLGRASQAVEQAAGLQSLALPVLYLNSNAPYAGLADLVSLEAIVSLEALTARQFSACPPWVIDPLKQYLVHMETARGEVVVLLYPEKAPLAVNNFIHLTRQGWFDGNPFHRVLPGQRVESGDPSGTGLGNPGYYFEVEIPEGLRFDRPGLLAMSNSGYGTNGSLFFITLAPAADLDGRATILGQVLSGMEALFALPERDPQPGLLLAPAEQLLRVTIEER